MAMFNGNSNAPKLVWEKLDENNPHMPKELRDAVAAVKAAHAAVESVMRKTKPEPKGRRWMFSYRYGVSVAMADATAGSGKTSYFS